MPESIIEANEEILQALKQLYRSTGRLNDCLGAVLAAQQGRLAEHLINPETFLPDVAQLGYREAEHHLELLNQLCERLHLDPMAMSRLPDPQQTFKIEYT